MIFTMIQRICVDFAEKNIFGSLLKFQVSHPHDLLSVSSLAEAPAGAARTARASPWPLGSRGCEFCGNLAIRKIEKWDPMTKSWVGAFGRNFFLALLFDANCGGSPSFKTNSTEMRSNRTTLWRNRRCSVCLWWTCHHQVLSARIA